MQDGTGTGGTRGKSHDERRKGLKDGLPGVSLETDLKRKQAVALRIDRMTYEEIARELGCSRTHAFRLVNDGWADLIDTTNEERRILRAIECENLDRILANLLPLAHADTLVVEKEVFMDGQKLVVREEDVLTRLKVVQTILKVGKRYADLTGIDAPRKIEDNGKGKQSIKSMDELTARVAELEAEAAEVPRGTVLPS